MDNNLIIFGSGQYGCIAKEIALSMNCFDKINFLDDNDKNAIGKIKDYKKFNDCYKKVAIAIGNPSIREKLIGLIRKSDFQLTTLISPFAFVSPSAKIHEGCIIEPMAVVQANTELSEGVIVSSGAVINHNSFIGSVCHIDCNAVVKSNSIIESGTKINCD